MSSFNAMRSSRSGGRGVRLEKTENRRRRLRTAALPEREALTVHLQHLGLRHGIPRPDVLEVPPVARMALIGDDHAVERGLLGTVTRQTDVNGHELSFRRNRRPGR